MGDQETKEGAFNRAERAAEAFEKAYGNKTLYFSVGLVSGLSFHLPLYIVMYLHWSLIFKSVKLNAKNISCHSGGRSRKTERPDYGRQ